MRMRTFIGGFAAGCAAMLLAATTIMPASPAPQDPAEMEKMMMEAMEKYGNPGPEHKALAMRVGDWKASVKHWMMPGTEPEIMDATCSFEMILDGRYLLQHFKGDFAGMPFEGAGLTAYDRFGKKYVNVWIDSMSTAAFVSEGKATDAAGKTVEYVGMSPDIFQEKYIKMRIVETVVDKDTIVAEMYGPGPDGEEYQTMEMTYTRAATADAGDR